MNELHKTERLNSKIVIEKMFEGGSSRSFSIFPLRAVYMVTEKGDAPASILISVPKKRFKRAVKRNRVKRQIREAYRINKTSLWRSLEERELKIAVAFIYLSDELISSVEIEAKLKLLLDRIAERLP